MSVIAGLPTVVGGVSSKEFLASIEVLDHSSKEQSPMGVEWRVGAHAMATPRYDFAYAAVPVSQVVHGNADMMNYVCDSEDMAAAVEGNAISRE